MLNSSKNAFALFKTQFKWNLKTSSMWVMIACYMVFTTATSIGMYAAAQSLQPGDLYGIMLDVFSMIVTILHVLMAAIMINVFVIQLYVNNKKHKIDELEKRAGYNGYSMFFSRLIWLVIVVFSTILINLILSSIIYAFTSNSVYEYVSYRVFVGVFGWEIVFSLMYMTLLMAVIFLFGPTRGSLFSMVFVVLVCFTSLFNMLVGNVTNSRRKELDWSIKRALWFDDSKVTEEEKVVLDQFIEFYSITDQSSYRDNTAFGYEYYKAVNENNNIELKYVENFFEQLDKVLDDKITGWEVEDSYLNITFKNMDIDKTVYDFVNDTSNLDYRNMTSEFSIIFKVLKHYTNELIELDSHINYDYWDYSNNASSASNNVNFYNIFNNKNTLLFGTTFIHWIMKNHISISEQMYLQNTEDKNTVVANSFENFNENAINPEWYVRFNPTTAEKVNMMLNPINHILYMQRTAQSTSSNLLEASVLNQNSGMSPVIESNVQIKYKDGKFDGFEKIIHVEGIYTFYALTSIMLLPLTYLLWRRKNK